jgi:hypothetical protein
MGYTNKRGAPYSASCVQGYSYRSSNTSASARGEPSDHHITASSDTVREIKYQILHLIGAVTLIAMVVRMDRIDVASILVYVIGLVTMLALSGAYNMWPVSPAK